MTLILLELFLSIVFILIGYLKGEIYFRGVGVGLIIAWVTSFIAYLFKRLNNKTIRYEK
jgi:VIT1/CCC1 family predicted Fe2+/Mn2+ transporter